MAANRKSRNLVNILLFVAFVAVSGLALAATGNLENPLRAFSQLSGGGRGGDFDGAEQATNRPTQSENGGGRGESNTAGISWSQTGDVLFNVWFICAVSAGLMVFQHFGSMIWTFARNRFKPAQPQALAP